MPTDEDLAARFGDAFPLLYADEQRMYRSLSQIQQQKRAKRRELLARIKGYSLKFAAAGAVAILSLIKFRT